MIKANAFSLSLAATAVLGFMTVAATAQQPPAQAPAAQAPAKVVPKVTPKAEAPVEAKAPVAPKPAATKAAAPSPCKGLDEAACKGKADTCGWIVPTKIDAKTGKADKAYCRKVAGIAKKKVEPAKTDAAAATAPKADAKAAVKTAPVTPPAATPKKQ